eukprot:CAMPEP_0203748742 /NCGR_PEP_ID=MMETSP0098-20131031/3553_1 /ASSEMBLY_ACC=CAM_ASM_000208 /TAXON_ID=96639 /ORGANISM=" , Strain NY0313808BC1" /LENGTH=209 /DNA_ID=CAMNT_0050637609 /DNA_START=3387 /DNA_END=4013 /DNA_ORIENTATION=+
MAPCDQVELSIEQVDKVIKDASRYFESMNSCPVEKIRWHNDLAAAIPVIPFEELEFTGILGRGRFGVVFEAFRGRGRVAAKLLIHVRGEDAQTLSNRFQQELQIWGQLFHPNILQLTGYAMNMRLKRYAFITEACDTTLARYIHDQREKPLSTKEVVSIAKGLAAALEYLHNRDITHCDVKPENILLLDACVKLCDFDGCVVAGGGWDP